MSTACGRPWNTTADVSPIRRNPVLRPRADGRFDLVVKTVHREAVDALLGELDALLVSDPANPALRRLRPPAYLDDPERDAGYQLLAGAELADSHRAALTAVRQSLSSNVLTEDEVWTWLRSLNSLRIVLATSLGIDDDEHVGPSDPNHPDAAMWEALRFATYLQACAVDALA